MAVKPGVEQDSEHSLSIKLRKLTCLLFIDFILFQIHSACHYQNCRIVNVRQRLEVLKITF